MVRQAAGQVSAARAKEGNLASHDKQGIIYLLDRGWTKWKWKRGRDENDPNRKKKQRDWRRPPQVSDAMRWEASQG